jgi:PAS domain S-box-containing protein
MQAEEKFRTAFTLSPDVMSIIKQSDLTILDINEKINEMLGYTRAELIGKSAGETMKDIWFNVDDRAEFYKNLERHEPVFEIRWRSRSGNEVYVLMSSAFISLSGESYILTIAKDITARKQAEEKFQTIFRLNPDMIAIVRKKDSVIVDINDKVYESIGYTKEELIGQRTDLLDIWLSEEDRKQGILNADNPTAVYEARLKNKNGQEVFTLVSGALIEIMGEPHLIYITKNITERKLADEKAKRNIEQLAYTEKELGEARVMALRSAMNPHFIFNALNSIQFFISKNERQQAIQYLSTFSKLIRGILTSSGQNMIKLADELELLKHYINLELIRFEKKFNVIFNIDSDIDKEIDIPALVIQPFVENAILHGLYAKSAEGNLKISVQRAGEAFIFFEIEDDGIGRVEARKVQAQKNLEHHKSLGVSLAEERLKIINSDPHLAVETEDLVENNKAVGTRVKIWLRIQ